MLLIHYCNITVASVTRLMMYEEFSSDNQPKVVCNGPVKLVSALQVCMVDFKLDSLAFVSCSRGFSDPLASTYVVLFDLVKIS